jgi:MerR family copper efflux transcriptional regulator
MSMNIGEAAEGLGGFGEDDSPLRERRACSRKRREPNPGYRQYTDKEVSTLRFVRQSRDLGFSIEQIRELLGPVAGPQASEPAGARLAQAHIEELDEKLEELQSMKATLEHLVHCCHGDDRPDCPIIDSLAQERSELERRPVGATGRSRRGMNGLRAGRGGRATD